MHRRYWEWPRPFGWTPGRTGLLVIDMQRGFVDEGPLAVPMARRQVPAIATVLGEFRSRNLPVFHTRFVVRPDLDIPFYKSRAPDRGLNVEGLEPDFHPGSRWAEIVDELSPGPGEAVVDKVAYDGFADTDLEGLLRSAHVETLVVVGTVVNWCVDSTLRGAFHRRFNCIVLSDGVSGYDHAGASGQQWVAQALDFFAEALAVVMPSHELLEALDEPRLRERGPARPSRS
jgi:nicotinamidase-related amidase